MKGSVMHRLFQRAFPGFFPYNSLHLWQPFHVPAMNYVLAQEQNVSADLEKLDELGLGNEILSKIRKIDAVFESIPNDAKLVGKALAKIPDGINFFDKRTETLSTLEKNHEVGYTKSEVLQIKKITESAIVGSAAEESATGNFVRLQMRFKPLKRAIRMPDSRFDPTNAIKVVDVTSYDTIVEQILAKPWIFKNPGYLDSQSIPNPSLRAILTGKVDKKVVEDATSELRNMVQQKQENYFLQYFVEKTKASVKENSREYQKIDVSGQNEKAQVSQIDVVSEYVHALNILLRSCLRTFTHSQAVLLRQSLLNSLQISLDSGIGKGIRKKALPVLA